MNYETNLTDARWTIQRQRKHSLRTIVDAILCVVKTGYQWRYLPTNFSKRHLVYYRFRKFEATRLIEILRDQFREQVRVKKVGKSVQVWV